MSAHLSPTRDVLASRVINWGDLCEEERERYTRFVVDNKVQFSRDADGAVTANIRLYNPHQFPEGVASRSKVRRARAPPAALPPFPPRPAPPPP